MRKPTDEESLHKERGSDPGRQFAFRATILLAVIIALTLGVQCAQ